MLARLSTTPNGSSLAVRAHYSRLTRIPHQLSFKVARRKYVPITRWELLLPYRLARDCFCLEPAIFSRPRAKKTVQCCSGPVSTVVLLREFGKGENCEDRPTCDELVGLFRTIMSQESPMSSADTPQKLLCAFVK